jgi:hypothetical protein
MTAEQLKQEFEKRIHTLTVSVRRVSVGFQGVERPMEDEELDDAHTLYYVIVSNHRMQEYIAEAMRRIPAIRMTYVSAEQTGKMLDNEAQSLLERWVIQRYFIQPKDRK